MIPEAIIGASTMALTMFRNFLSPIDDFSNLPFRLLCQRYGADAVCVPLVNSTAIAHDPAKAAAVDAHPDERNVGVQLVGNVPEDIIKSAAIVEGRFPSVSWYNINCGCPSARTMKCGGGSAMLAYPERIARAVEGMKGAAGKPVSVKIRIKNNIADTLGWVLYKQGAYPRAEALLREAAEKLPTNAEVVYHLGMAQAKLDKNAEARASLEKSLQLSATHPGAAEAKAALAALPAAK